MRKKRFGHKKQADSICLQLLNEKQEQIDKLSFDFDMAKADIEFLRSEKDNITRLFHAVNKDAERQMATTKYVVLINLMMDTLAKTLEDNTPMASVIRKAIREYKKTISQGMLLFKFDGERCVYDPTDEDGVFDFEYSNTD